MSLHHADRHDSVPVDTVDTLRQMIAGMDSAVFALDREYRYLAFNPAHAAFMKSLYGVDIAVGGALPDYQHVPEDWLAAQQNLDRALAGETVTTVASSGDPARTQRYFEVRHVPLRTADNQIYGVAVYATDVTERESALHEARSLLAQNQLVLREVHHRIKNNMAMVDSVLALQASTVNDSTAEVISTTRRRVQGVVTLYERLMRTAEYENVMIREYVDELIDSVMETLVGDPGESRAIRVDRRLGTCRCTVATKHVFPIGLVVNELITNSFKHAFPHGREGAITLSLSPGPDHTCVLRYEDDGVGLAADAPGSQPEQVPGEHLGMTLIRELSRQIGTEAEIGRGGTPGFQASIPIPVHRGE
ncbi:MAG: hypothetical protein EA403_12130 [Spirochaetaceae bacterium]|nr:MAG: hypothetical protein EA403_12130 [Spirochaetaceae bacterium]